MGKARSPETEVRYLRSSLREAKQAAHHWELEFRRMRLSRDEAVKEASEWEARFDLLLSRTPAVPRG